MVYFYLVLISHHSGLFGRGPAPIPSAVSAGVLPNTLKVEQFYTIACEKVEQWLCLREGGAGGTTKTSSSSTLFAESRSPPKQALRIHISILRKKYSVLLVHLARFVQTGGDSV